MIKLNKMETFEIHYDKDSDFLEIFFGEPTSCLTEEIEPDVFIRKDEKTKEIKSVGIFSFKKRPNILKKILEKINLTIPLNISID